MSKTFSKNDVASHNKGDSLWIIVDDDVYDLTKFQDEHPGMLLFEPLKQFRTSAINFWDVGNTCAIHVSKLNKLIRPIY